MPQRHLPTRNDPARWLIVACVVAIVGILISWIFSPPDALSIVVLLLLIGCPLAHVLMRHRH